jgi:hypothetical protein
MRLFNPAQLQAASPFLVSTGILAIITDEPLNVFVKSNGASLNITSMDKYSIHYFGQLELLIDRKKSGKSLTHGGCQNVWLNSPAQESAA